MMGSRRVGVEPGRLRPRRSLCALLVAVLVVIIGLTVAWIHRPTVVSSPSCRADAGGQSAELDPDQARYAALIAGMAVKRNLPPRAATVALATAAQESRLRNIGYGDRDSLGLFQQRVSQGWGSRDQIMNPVLSSRTFYNHLLKIPGWQNMPVTKAAQTVQHSAYPQAYADHEEESRALAAAFYGQYPASLACELPAPKAAPGAANRVATNVSSDLGPEPVQRTDSRLTYRYDDSATGRQHAWGLAHWAVASADEFGITSVHVAGRVWQRSDADASWAQGGEGGADTVVIEVAA